MGRYTQDRGGVASIITLYISPPPSLSLYIRVFFKKNDPRILQSCHCNIIAAFKIRFCVTKRGMICKDGASNPRRPT